MTHSCRQLQSELTYWFSQGDSQEMPEEMRRQITICPDCRECMVELRESQKLLKLTREDPEARLEKSLWTQIQKRIKAQALPSQPVPKMEENTFRNTGRLMSPERTDFWSQRIAILSITLALFAVAVGPIAQMFSGQHPQGANSQIEFSNFRPAERPMPEYFYDAGKNPSLHRDVSLPHSNNYQIQQRYWNLEGGFPLKLEEK